MKLASLVFAFAISHLSLACGNHPGMTHEQWTSAVKAEMNKDGKTYQTFSGGFFDKRPAAQGESAPQSRPVEEDYDYDREPVSEDY